MLLRAFLCACALLLAARHAFAMDVAAPGPQMIWIEGEKPSEANFEFDVQNWGPVFSGDGWLHYAKTGDAAKQLPDGGLQLAYRFDSAKAGRHELWVRLGLEWVRAPLQWRLNGGEWQDFGPDRLTTNLLELGVWAEIGWGLFGTVDLQAGQNVLDIRCVAPNGDRLIIAIDCMALAEGEGNFTPEGTLRPGQQYEAQVDRDAAGQIYAFPAAERTANRAELPLDGLWQVARYDDPDMDTDTYKPVEALPAARDYELKWRGIQVPGNARSRPDLRFGHRLLYRARVDVPADLAGRSFHLHFSGTNWIAGVIVNGIYCGGRQSVLVPWDCDITKAVRPGQVNEIVITIKSSWYALEPNREKGETIDHLRNRPYDGDFKNNYRFVDAIYPSTKGEGDGMAVGIVNPVKLVAAGDAYTSDIYICTSVAKKRLEADVEVTNARDSGADLTVVCEAVNDRTGQIEASFGPAQVAVPAGRAATVTLAGDWPDPKLWWPERNPSLYVMRTKVMEGDRALDIQKELFGFREVSIQGKDFLLNGIPWHFWNWVGVNSSGSDDDWLATYEAQGDRFHRISTDSDRRWGHRERALDFDDRNGIPGRLSTCIDGMAITHDLRNPLVWQNFQNHVRQVVEAYRNHPSIMMWSLGNEMIFITSRLAYNAEDNLRWMAEAQKLSDVAKELDPTRDSFQDGGGDLNRAGAINCQHYPLPRGADVPAGCYSYRLREGKWEPRNTWDRSMIQYAWDGERPLVLGECFYYSGNVSGMAWIGGPDVYRGKSYANKAAARYARIAIEGARWQGVTGICPWVGPLQEALVSFKPRAVFVREYDSSFFPGAELKRTIKVFNDGRSGDPLTLNWRLVLDGKEVASGHRTYPVPPGRDADDVITAALPAASERLDGQLELTLSAGGEQVFEDSKPVSVLPAAPAVPSLAEGTLAVYDPRGKIVAWLKGQAVAYTGLDSLARLPDEATTLLIGPDALGAEDRAETVAAIRRFVDAGKTALVLEQTQPLGGDELPVSGIEPAGNRRDQPARPEFLAAGGVSGRVAFPVAVAHPVLAGLTADDFFTWADGEQCFRASYASPTGGVIQIIQAGNELRLAPMLDIPVGRGGYLLSQMLIGEKLGVSPVADRLLANMLNWAAARAGAEPGRTVACLEGDDVLRGFLDKVQLAYSPVNTPKAALSSEADIAIVRATPDALQQLAADKDGVRAFCEPGRWLMLVGVDSDGLAAFDDLVGVNHRLRPFRREAVTIEARTDPLLMGLTDRDVNMISDQVLAPWANLNWVSDRTFSGVVDAGADIASFAQFDNDYLTKVANGLTNDDFWQYICYFGGTERAPVLELPYDRPETFTGIDIWSNESYHFMKDIEVVFDDDQASALKFTLQPTKEKQELTFEPRRASKVTIRMLDSYPSQATNELVGIDLLRLWRELPADWQSRVVSLTNPGGLVKYPIGEGGIVLNNVAYAAEDTPENVRKKLAIYSNMLRNMGAAFGQ